jgi:hypothetical protein
MVIAINRRQNIGIGRFLYQSPQSLSGLRRPPVEDTFLSSRPVAGLAQRRVFNIAVSRAAPVREAVISLPNRSCSFTR